MSPGWAPNYAKDASYERKEEADEESSKGADPANYGKDQNDCSPCGVLIWVSSEVYGANDYDYSPYDAEEPKGSSDEGEHKGDRGTDKPYQ